MHRLWKVWRINQELRRRKRRGFGQTIHQCDRILRDAEPSDARQRDPAFSGIMILSTPGRLTSLAFGGLCLASTTLAHAEPALRTGTIIMGVPRSDFVVLGADRLWSKALPKPEDPPSKRRGRLVKIALHGSLPLAVAAAGLATLGSEQDTIDYIRELITPLDASSLNFDTIVELLRAHLHEKVRAVREPAKRALATNPADAEAKIRLKVARLTLFVAYVATGRATLGWVQLDDDWKAKRESAPHGAVAWPDSLDRFYMKGPFAGGATLFGYSIQQPAKLVEHVRRMIEAGIREEARLNYGRNRQVGGPVDVVLVDAKSARCVASCGLDRGAGRALPK